MEFDSFFEKNYCAEKDCCFSTNTDWVELYWDDMNPELWNGEGSKPKSFNK